jgi:tRNA(Ile)-lysidine synthase
MGELRVLRPLLSCSRADLLAWAQARGLDWVEDPSNLDTRRQRNRIRHEVLPVLEAALPGFGAQLEQLARQAHETREAVEALAHRDLETVRQAGSAALDRRALQALGAVRAGGVLRAWIEEAGLRPPTRARLQEMWRQLVESEATYGLVVHDGRRLRRHRDLVLWEAETAPEVAAPWPFRWQGEAFLPVPGRSGGLRFERVAAPEAPAGAPGVEWLRAQSLVVRPPRARDRLRPHAGGPQRSLRNLFQEQGVPAWARPACHVLECAGRVLLVAGLGADQSPDWPGEGDRVRVSWVSDPRQPPV